ncbi:MAG: DUF2314 domain-containing protein [Pseudomonadota bacterium]
MRKTVITVLTAIHLSAIGVPTLVSAQQGDDPNLESVEADDPEMNAAIAEAQRTLPTFLAVLEDPPQGASNLSFKFPLSGWEHIWVSNLRRDGDYLIGRLSNVPQQPEWSEGDPVRVPMKNISDWAWLDSDGVMQGHHTTRVILRRIDPKRAAMIRNNLGWNR